MAYLNYEQLLDAALLSVVKEALTQVSKEGLQADHHFYITFLTEYPGVELPDYIRQEYPSEITIVLQHEFWNLKVEKDYFMVDVSFGESLESLKVPFKSLVHVSDPSVNFELEFNPQIPSKLAKMDWKKPELVAAPVTEFVKGEDPKSSQEEAISEKDTKKPKKGILISLESYRNK
jgi:hypothetical protein